LKVIKNWWFKVLKVIIKSLILFILGILLIINGFYLTSKVYDFPVLEPFSGGFIHNPYQNISDLTQYRGNFHAHSVAWKGITDGNETEEDVFNAYVNQGYDIPSISNYHNISRYGEDKEYIYIPTYEHGYNIRKSHLLAIDAEKVSFYDFFFKQSSSQKQQIINHLRSKASIVALAHPAYWQSRSEQDMKHLVNYELTEILNHNKDSEEYWDYGLSNGRLTWCLGDDDTHGIDKEPTFMRWNMIFGKKRDKVSILNALKKGQHYSVFSPENKLKVQLISCLMTDSMTFEVQLSEEVEDIYFIGQNGQIKDQSGPGHKAFYSFTPEDTYIRVVVHHLDGKMFLNPLVRYDGLQVPLNTLNKATVNNLKTWGQRGLFLIPLLLLIFLARWTIKF
jgi:hypothetical protein